jgi:hypothetical protein
MQHHGVITVVTVYLGWYESTAKACDWKLDKQP